MAAKNKKTKAYRLGLWGELIVRVMLFLKGYRVLAQRFKTPVGEIDLIAMRGHQLVCVEVKARSKETEVTVSNKQRQRILRAAALFIAKHQEFASFPVRMDVVLLRYPFHIHHIQNAWIEG
jgi:putative endonuclease